MSIFSFTGSALSNLTGNTPGANVSNLVTLLNDLKTFINGGNLDGTNIAAGGVGYTQLAATVDARYALVHERVGFSGGATAGVIVFAANTSIMVPITSIASALGVFYLSSADYPVSSRTAKLRLAAMNLINNTAPGINYTYGLYPVTAVANPGANAPSITGLGAVVAGSTCAINAPSPQSLNHVEGTDFSFPSAGFYTIGIGISGTETANSVPIHNVALQVRVV